MNSPAFVLSFDADGSGQCLFSEALPLSEIGTLDVRRASEVEFNAASQRWEVRFVGSPDVVRFSHESRAECIRWEVETLQAQF